MDIRHSVCAKQINIHMVVSGHSEDGVFLQGESIVIDSSG